MSYFILQTDKTKHNNHNQIKIHLFKVATHATKTRSLDCGAALHNHAKFTMHCFSLNERTKVKQVTEEVKLPIATRFGVIAPKHLLTTNTRRPRSRFRSASRSGNFRSHGTR